MGMIYSPRGNSVLPNGTLINEVCQIYQSTRPTTRPNGSALQLRDIWYNTATGVRGFWNGTYWLGAMQVSSLNLNSSASGVVLFGQLERRQHLVVQAAFLTSAFNTMIADSSNFWSVQLSFADTVGGYETTYFVDRVFNTNLPTYTNEITALNQTSVGPTVGASIETIRWSRIKTGSPSNLNMTYMIHTHPVL